MSGVEIGRAKRKSGGAPRKARPKKQTRATKKALKKTFKSTLKDLDKLKPSEQLKKARAIYKNMSPLNQMRMKKALKEARKKELQIEQGEPFNIEMPETPESAEFVEEGMEQAEESGEAEVNEPEFPEAEGTPDSEEEGEGMGVQLFPESLSGKAERKARKQAKTEKIKAKASAKTASGEAKKMRAQAKQTKAEKGGGGAWKDIAEAGKGLLKKDEGGAPAPEPSWFEKNKMLVIGGGALLLVGGFMLMRKKR